MSALFIRRPVFACVISIVIVLMGFVAIGALPVARYPEIAPPTVTVSAIYPGADAETIASTVAAPLEEQINGVEGMTYLSSIAADDGTLTITVTFEIGTDLDLATVYVQNRVAIAEPRLPEEVRRQGVSVQKRSNEITMLISLSSEGVYDGLFLSNYASLRLRNELARVDGVGDIFVFGEGEYGMRIWIDPALLHARNLTTNDVVAAIQAQNVQVAAGLIGAPPTPDDVAFQYTVTTRGRFETAEDFGRIVVRTDADGAIVRLSDIATIELGAQSYSLTSRTNGRDSATIAVYLVPGANAITTVEGLEATMARLSEAFPAGLGYDIAYRSTDVIRASIREVLVTLAIAVVLVVLTVYVFLQNVRATLIPALTIPVSLVGTFAVMLLLGFSINLLTLFGLVLAIGIVVDDAIVVVENVSRHLEEGLEPREAALQAMSEVSGAVIATTLVLLSVFIPTAFLPGIVGQLYRQFALTIAISTVFSSINALTLSPALAGVLLRKPRGRKFIAFRLFDAAFDRVTSVYAWIVSLLVRLAIVAVPASIALLVGSVLLYGRIPTGFIPQEDEGWCIVNVQLPSGAAFGRTDEVLTTLASVAEETPGVRTVIAVPGYSMLDGAASSSRGVLFVIFDDWSERGPGRHQRDIVGSLNARFASELDAVAMAFPLPSLPGLGTSGGLAFQVEDLAGAGVDALASATWSFVGEATSDPAIGRLFSTFDVNSPRLFVDIDRDQMETLALSPSDVFGTLGAALGSAYVNDFTAFGKTYQVRLQSRADRRARPDDILSLDVRNANGDMVPFGAFADVQERTGPAVVARHNVYTAAKVIGAPAPGVTGGVVMGAIERKADELLGEDFAIEWIELAYQQKAATGSAAMVFAFGLLLVYLVLAAQYESWTLPISVCLSVPLAFLGVAVALLSRGLVANVYAQIGLVLLIGLAAKSAILIVEFARDLRNQGRSIHEAAIESSRLRFRAILMTALSFVLGVIPLAVASGAGAQSRIALGTTVLGGMIASTIFGIFLVPVFYVAVQSVTERIANLFKGE